MNWGAVLFAVACLAVLAGCGDSGEMSKKDEDQFKSGIASGKGEFDMNKVPEDKRAMVESFMKQGKTGVRPGSPKPDSTGQ